MAEILPLFYIPSNAFVPLGKVTSTARRGRKWFDAVEVGDTVNLCITEVGTSFGLAIVVAKELTTYEDAINEASHNHCAFNPKYDHARFGPQGILAAELCAAYGNVDNDEAFTILHIVVLTGGSIQPPARWPNAVAACNSENDYQIDKLGDEGQVRSIDEWCSYIADYAKEAVHQGVRGDEMAALHTIRKVATMALVCMEDFNAPHREGF